MWKRRIIIVFTMLTALLVLLMARLSYYFVRDLYLDQLSDHVRTVTMLLVNRIDRKNLNLLALGNPPQSLEAYFAGLFATHLEASGQSDVFIFDKHLQTVVSLKNMPANPAREPELLLYRQQISGLQSGSSLATRPFKGDDGMWYLWGFSRLDQEHWLAVRESAGRLQRVESFSLIFWYIGLGGIVVTLIIAWLLARGITLPLERLVKFSGAIGAGDFDQPAPEGTRGEIGSLTRAMDKMRHDLKEHQREKEAILAQIAHEIRNPLGGIELMANLLREDMTASQAESKYLDRISAEVAGLKGLITSYLEYSRPQKAHPESIRVETVFREINELLQDQLQERRISLQIKNASQKINFDPGHLRQVVLNLINNAMDAVGSGGVIRVSADSSGSRVQVKVADNGRGIDAADIDRIFEPFFTSKNEGTGLGLAICRKLCHENGALLYVKNNNTEGCTFFIESDRT